MNFFEFFFTFWIILKNVQKIQIFFQIALNHLENVKKISIFFPYPRIRIRYFLTDPDLGKITDPDGSRIRNTDLYTTHHSKLEQLVEVTVK